MKRASETLKIAVRLLIGKKIHGVLSKPQRDQALHS